MIVKTQGVARKPIVARIRRAATCSKELSVVYVIV
jgi:hypothetical protein